MMHSLLSQVADHGGFPWEAVVGVVVPIVSALVWWAHTTDKRVSRLEQFQKTNAEVSQLKSNVLDQSLQKLEIRLDRLEETSARRSRRSSVAIENLTRALVAKGIIAPRTVSPAPGNAQDRVWPSDDPPTVGWIRADDD